MRSLTLDDVVTISAAVLEVASEDVRRILDPNAIETVLLAQVAPPHLHEGSARLASRGASFVLEFVRSKPLPHSNDAIAWEALREFVWRNGQDLGEVQPDEAIRSMRTLHRPGGDGREFAVWLNEQLTTQIHSVA